MATNTASKLIDRSFFAAQAVVFAVTTAAILYLATALITYEPPPKPVFTGPTWGEVFGTR